MATYEQDIPELNFIVYEDERWIETVTVKNNDGSNYDFTGATAALNADSTRPATGTADLQLTSSGGDITLSSGTVVIDATHGLSTGSYEYDFLITVSTKTTMLFKGKIEVKSNV